MNVDQDEVRIEISVIGYDTYSEIVSQSSDNYSVKLVPNDVLNGLSIKSVRPIFNQVNGKTHINVDQTILATMSNLSDLFQKSPGLIYNNEGVTVVGKGLASVYLNGQKISLDRLSSIPVAQIDYIEVIKNPGPQYDAESQAVVVIHLKENGAQGYQASILQHYTKAFYHLYFLDANLNFRKDRFSLMLNYNVNLGGTGVRAKNVLDINSTSQPYLGKTNYLEKTTLKNVSNYAIGMSYRLSNKSKLSFEYGGNYSDSFVKGDNTIDVSYDDGQHNRISALNDSENLWKLNTVSANYKLNTDTLGHYLFIGANATINQVLYSDLINEIQKGDNGIIGGVTSSKGDNKNELYTLQIDQTSRFLKAYELGFGVKYSQAELNSTIDVNSLLDNSLVLSEIGAFVYDEKLFGSYFSLKRTYNKLNYELGLRAEHVNALAERLGELEPYYTLNQWNLFPSAEINLVGKKISWHQSYSMRIARPSYKNITPFFYYMNSLTSIQGNPAITPTYTHAFESKVSVQMASLALGYNHSIDPTVFLSRVDDVTENNVIQRVNVDRLNSVYTQLAIPAGYKFWESYNMVNVSLDKYEDSNINFSNSMSRPKFYAYTYNSFNIKDWIKLEMIAEYQGAYSDGSRSFLPSGALNMGASKTFGKTRQWMVQLFLNDVFQTSLYRVSLEIDQNQTDWHQTNDTRFFRCLLKYQFGKLKQVDYEHNKVNDDAVNRAR